MAWKNIWNGSIKEPELLENGSRVDKFGFRNCKISFEDRNKKRIISNLQKKEEKKVIF